MDKVHEFEARFLQELRTSHQRDVLDVLKTGVINDEIRGILEKTAKEYGFIERNKSPDRLYTETQKITAAMKMVSSAKLHHAQTQTEHTLTYANKLSLS